MLLTTVFYFWKRIIKWKNLEPRNRRKIDICAINIAHRRLSMVLLQCEETRNSRSCWKFGKQSLAIFLFFLVFIDYYSNAIITILAMRGQNTGRQFCKVVVLVPNKMASFVRSSGPLFVSAVNFPNLFYSAYALSKGWATKNLIPHTVPIRMVRRSANVLWYFCHSWMMFLCWALEK